MRHSSKGSSLDANELSLAGGDSRNREELFTEYGLRILGRSGAHLTFVVQLTGPAHYLPTAEAVRGAGYSGIPESCVAGPEGGNALVDETVERIHAMWK